MADGVNILYSDTQSMWCAFVASTLPPNAILAAMRWALDKCYLPRLRAAPAGPRRDAMKAKVDALKAALARGEAVPQFIQAKPQQERLIMSNEAAYKPSKLISIPTGSN